MDRHVDHYQNPGPVQFYGPASLTDSVPITLSLETYDYMGELQSLHAALARIEAACRPGCPTTVLQVASKGLSSLDEIIKLISVSSISK
jgi:hypothetical protein